MIKNIIFDIGNVLMEFHWKAFITSIFDDPEDIKQVEDSMWHTGLWNELDRNIMTEEEIFQGMRDHNPAYADKVDYTLAKVPACFVKVDYAIPWLQELKAEGYHIYYLSNYSPFAMRCNPNCLDFLPLMDGGVFSCDCKLVKPDPAIYKYLCDKYSFNPSECVFLDDREDNIEAAKAYGMHGIVVSSHEQAKAELKELVKCGSR